MRVSLKWLKKYIDLPSDLTYQKIAYDLTEKTVEVEKIENIKDKYNNIVVGKIIEVKKHPNADLLRICMVDIGDKVVQIVCGGSNLYENELVVVSLPGALVHWHGEAELVKIKETKMRGVQSYGMICGASEVFLEELFPPSDEHEIVDLKGICCKPGDLISEVLGFDDIAVSSQVSPSLTTISQDCKLRAKITFDLVNEVEDDPFLAKNIVIPVSVIERESVIKK